MLFKTKGVNLYQFFTELILFSLQEQITFKVIPTYVCPSLSHSVRTALRSCRISYAPHAYVISKISVLFVPIMAP
jgi:hypothetical protein